MAVPALLMEDHCEAYPFWKELGLQGRTCVHVDAHLDVSGEGFTPEGLRHIADCRTREELEAWRGSDFLPWGGFHCGNYLYPALLEGLVDHLVWVVPPHLPGDDPLAWARTELQGWVELTRAEYRGLHLEEGRVQGTLAGRRLTICTSACLPPLPEGVLLDLDVDYFLDADDGIWQTPAELRAHLAHLRPAAVTVAFSVNGGYLPLEHRYLGHVAFAVFAQGDSRWDETVRRIVEGGPLPPGERPAWLRAALALRRGDPEQAAREDPDHALQPINQGALHFRRGEYADADRWLERAAAEHPAEEALCRYMQGLADFKAGRPERAADRWEPLLEHPRLGAAEKGYVAFMRGIVLAKLPDRMPEAVEALRQAVSCEPENPVYLHHFGLALKEAGHLDEAARELRRSLRLGPDRLGSVDVRMGLAEVYEAQGKRALAQAEHRLIRETDVTGAYALRSLLRGS